MKRFIFLFQPGFIAFFSLLFFSCEEIDQVGDAIQDVQSLTSLSKVDFSYDTATVDVSLPEMSLGGKTFQELYQENKVVYGDPANYLLSINAHFLADNTADDAKDAKFDGMIQDLVFNNINETPLRVETSGFELEKGKTLPVVSSGEINLGTHRAPGVYIFQQIVDGNPINTKILNKLLYTLGPKEGSLDLPSIQKDIPTRASDEMKVFLQDLLNSGVLDETEN